MKAKKLIGPRTRNRENQKKKGSALNEKKVLTKIGFWWLCLVIGASLLAGPGLKASEAQAAATVGTRLVLLGTGTPNCEPDRAGPALAVIVDDVAYLVDCGPGVVRRAVAASKKKGLEALKPANLLYLFITHLHSDHTLGYPDLILSPWVLGRAKPLEVYGPPGLKKMTRHLLKAYQEDISVRLLGLQPANREGYQVHVQEIKPGLVFQDERVKVEAFPVKHESWPYAFGYRFESRDKVIVISGDTRPCEELIASARGCDILVHEVYSAAKLKEKPLEWQRYHRASHTSGEELGKIAREVKPGLLVLVHQLYWGASDEELLQEVRRYFSGRVVSGRDLMVF
ncbi:MAG: MBL fold metallo-hydrolase [Candidatus Aminicenantes bacterium]|nr:MAG: MBL fold metallo-hydrolase [Candidatus Aminicenantes bacterium]